MLSETKILKDCSLQELLDQCWSNEFRDCRSCAIYNILNNKTTFNYKKCPIYILEKHKNKEIDLEKGEK